MSDEERGSNGANLIPQATRRALAAYGGDAGRAFLAELPDRINTYVRAWQLTLEFAYETGESSWKAAARTRDGRAVVLKLPGPEPDALRAVEALRAWNGHGAVLVLDADDRAMLLERCEPGTHAGVLDARDRIAVASDVLGALWSVAPPHGLDLLADRLAHVADVVEARLEPLSRTTVPTSIVDEALAVFRELPATAASNVLLHGDFGWNNVVLSQRGWLAIDPEPAVGDPAFEAANFVADYRDVDMYDEHVAVLCDRLSLDSDRLRSYLLAQVVRHLSWFAQSGDHAATVAAAGRVAAVAALLE